jgi:hypothetical protein
MPKVLVKKKRGLRAGLSQLLKVDGNDDLSISESVKLTPPENAVFYGVIRTKGGSGEVHTVKKLIDELLSKNKKVIVCYENKIEDVESDYTLNYFQSPVNKLIELCDINNEQGGVINLNWRNNSELSKLFQTIANLDDEYSIIMTTGTCSGTNLTKKISQISLFCNRIFITVDSLVDNSITPARNLCFSDELELHKIYFCWWHKVFLTEKTEHLFGIFKAKDIKNIQPCDLNTKIKKGMINYIMLD